MLLDPEHPFVVREEDGLEAYGERHAHGEEEVLVVDEGEEVGEGDGDDHDEDEVCLVWREDG